MKKVEKNYDYHIGIIDSADYTKGDSYGGSTAFIKNIISQFSFQQVTIVGQGLNGTEPWKPVELAEKKIFVPICDFKFPSKIPMRIKALYAYTMSVKKILKFNFDILYVHSPEICLPFLFFNKKIPVIYHQHGFSNALHASKYPYGEFFLFRKFFDFAQWVIFKRADWIIVIDPIGMIQAQKAGAEQKTSLMLNAVDTDYFKPDLGVRNEMRQRLGIKNGQCVILNAGRIEKQKGIQRILECIPIMRENNFNFHIIIVGEGTYRAKLLEYVNKNDFSEYVTFSGRVEHDLLPMYYNMADVFVLPSEREGVPMSILESIACGTPAIANAVGGIPNFIINGKNGFLLKNLLPETISSNIINLYDSNCDRAKVAETIRHLSSKNSVLSLLKIVKNILNY